MPSRHVAVAIVARGVGAKLEFLVTLNDRWNEFSFPTKRFDPNDTSVVVAAKNAIEEDLGPIGPVNIEPIDVIIRGDISGRTGVPTEYCYHSVIIDAPELVGRYESFDGESRLGWVRTGWLNYDKLVRSRNVSWSTKNIARAIVDDQDVALAITTRMGAKETEYLLVWNDRYQGYIFPTARVTEMGERASFIVKAVREQVGYRGGLEVIPLDSVIFKQFSPRYQRDRGFHFHIYSAQPIEGDLNTAETFHAASGRSATEAGEPLFLWLTSDEIDRSNSAENGSVKLSPTMSFVWPVVKNQVPSRQRAEIRKSVAGLGLITRTVNEQTEFLCQFHEKTRGFFLIGGHQEASESFRHCVIREVMEELAIEPSDFTVANEPRYRLGFLAYSQSAKVDTEYEIELFEVTLSPEALIGVERNPHNRWLNAVEIKEGETFAGQHISVDTQRILSRCGLL